MIVWWLRAQALESGRAEPKAQPHHLLAVSPKASYYPLTPSFPHLENGHKNSTLSIGCF